MVTDPGSPLDQSATEAGYRVFRADPTVGGRYSALTAFGLVPSGLAGADIGALLDEAASIRGDLEDDSVDNPGLRLGALLGWPTWPESTSSCWATPTPPTPASATGPSS